MENLNQTNMDIKWKVSSRLTGRQTEILEQYEDIKWII